MKADNAMKVLGIVGAALMLAATNTPAQEVLSANAVGYINIEAIPGYQMVSMPLDAPDSTIGEIMGEALVGNNNAGVADQLIKWDPVEQKYVTFFKRLAGEWRKVGEQAATTETLVPGEAFWIVNRGVTNRPITFLGEVPADPSMEVQALLGYNFVSVAYPVEMGINDLGLYEGAVKSNNAGLADQIIRWDSTANDGKGAYVTYFARLSDGWRKVGEQVSTTDKIGVGEGFWYVRRGTEGRTWNQAKPYNWPGPDMGL